MSQKAIAFFLLIIGFMGACTRKADNYIFEEAGKVAVDESKIVLTRFPSQLEMINDSVIAAVNSYRQLSLYNLYTGKNTSNFSSGNISLDSLVKNTFQKKYKGEKEFAIDTQSPGFRENNAQVSSFYHSDDNFYIHVRVMAETRYLKDSSVLEEYAQNEKIRQLKKMYAKVDLKMTEYLGFLFVTDKYLRPQRIIPLYTAENLKKNNFIALYERAFIVKDNYSYVYLLQTNESYETMSSKKQKQKYYLVKLDLDNEKNIDYLLNSEEIDFDNFTINDYLTAPVRLIERNNMILYCNGKEICEAESGKKIFSGKNLRPNEWIESFYTDDKENIIMVNYQKDKKKQASEFEKQYSVDSINSMKIRVFDTSPLKWIHEEELPGKPHLPVLVSKDKIIYLEKDKENYYFVYRPYHEN